VNEGNKLIATWTNKEIDEESVHPAVKLCRWILLTSWFEPGMIAAITLNALCMCLPYHGMSDEYEKVIYIIEATFTVIFVLELFIKLLGMGVEGYFGDSNNVFDFFIVLTTTVGYAIEGKP